VKSDCAKTVSPADNALWKFMVNRGRDFFPKIEHVAIGRKRSDRSFARPAGDKRFPRSALYYVERQMFIVLKL
jgi:hypothetical protein